MKNKISLDQHVENSNVLAEIGGDRRCYVVLHHGDSANSLSVMTMGVTFCNPIEEMLKNKTAILNLSFNGDDLPEPNVLQICDEIIVPTGTKIASDFVSTRFKMTQHGDNDVYFQRHLDVTELVVFKNAKQTNALLETLTGTKWEGFHKAHFYPKHNLLLKVLWDRREIMEACVIDDDAKEVLIQSQHDDDNLVRYAVYSKDIETLMSIKEHIDFVICDLSELDQA
jgi:hypothetical protein